MKILENTNSYYTINENNHEIPVVISIPHSGIYIDDKMKDKLLDNVVFPNTDWYLPELYSFLEELGFTVVVNKMNRHLIDVNRDIDNNMGNSYKDSLVYLNTTQGYPMYKKDISDQDIQERIDNYYLPYHHKLKELLETKKEYFNKVYLIDLHSFGLDYGYDVILGDNRGKSCSCKTTRFIKKQMRKQGLTVTKNNPFAGGYITKYYGNYYEAIQIELWYQCYINKRFFGNEELPLVSELIFNETSNKLKNVFINLKEWVKKQQ